MSVEPRPAHPGSSESGQAQRASVRRKTAPRGSRALPAVFWAGLACGALDITAAFVTWGVQGVVPARILRGIASGLLGPKALTGGWKTAALGGALHFFIAFTAAAVFYLASRKQTILTRRPVLAGIFYGVAVYVVMYWIVKPLSLVRSSPFSWSATAIAIATHIVCIGLPISLVVRRLSR